MKIVKANESDIKDIAKVHVDSWKETYCGIIHEDILRIRTYIKRRDLWRQIIRENKALTYVAKANDGKVVGFISGGKERTGTYEYDAEIYAIYILQAYQGQKVGKQLVHTIAKELYEQGYHSAMVWVIENNPSKYFYEKLEGKRIDKKYIENLQIYEVAYGWCDMNVLFKKS